MLFSLGHVLGLLCNPAESTQKASLIPCQAPCGREGIHLRGAKRLCWRCDTVCERALACGKDTICFAPPVLGGNESVAFAPPVLGYRLRKASSRNRLVPLVALRALRKLHLRGAKRLCKRCDTVCECALACGKDTICFAPMSSAYACVRSLDKYYPSRVNKRPVAR